MTTIIVEVLAYTMTEYVTKNAVYFTSNK